MKFSSGFEENLPPSEILITKAGLKRRIRERQSRVTRGTTDVANLTADLELIEKEETKEGSALFRKRRRREKRNDAYNAERDARLAPLLPADMVCRGCHRAKPRRRQWTVVSIKNLPDVAMCIGCARKLRNTKGVKR